MRSLTVSLLISLQLTAIYSSSLPSPKSCKAWDTPCVSLLAKEVKSLGIPEIPGLGAVRLDPIIIDDVKLEQDGLSLQLTGSKIEGLKNFVLDELSAKTNITSRRAKFHTDVLVTGQYKADGTLLFMPVSGAGDFCATLKNLEVEIVAPNLVVNKVDGVDVVEATDYTLRYDVKDDAVLRINDNTFGNSVLSDLMNIYVNYNYNIISSPFGKTLVAKIVDEVAQLYRTKFPGQQLNVLY